MNFYKKGFSLVEIIVAIAILLIMVIVYQVILVNTLLARTVRNRDLALKIASHQMENLRSLGYPNLGVSRTFADTQLSSLPSGSGAIIVDAYNAKVKHVVVTVSWQDQVAGSKSVALDTLVTETGGLK